jgi:hypothetical protein
MKKTVTLLLLMGCLVHAQAQDFAGYRTGNYTGVNGVYFNPANIADSRYRWDANLISLNVGVGNNQASFKLSELDKTFSGDSIQNQFFGKDKGATKGLINLDVHGPAFMFNTPGKFTFAITTRVRVVGNVNDIDGKLIDKISNDFTANDPDLPYTLKSQENMRVNVSGWSEYGVAVAREVFNVGPHFIKAGITLKYLAGVGNGNINIDHFNGTMNADEVKMDAYLSNTTGRIGTSFAGINFSDFEASQLTKFTGHGFGTDLGAVYEFRPAGTGGNRNNQYKFRLGVALLDIGKIKFEKDMQRSGTYDMNITGGRQFYLGSLDGVQLDNYNQELAKYPLDFVPNEENNKDNYSISLPTTLQLDGDYHIHNGFFVNMGVQLALTNGKKKPFNSQYYSSVTITPRYESTRFGFYLPINYNGLTKMNAGASVRVGPVFFGSGSVLSALFSSSKQLDGFLGIRFGNLQKKRKS